MAFECSNSHLIKRIFFKKNDDIHGKDFVDDIHIDYSFTDNREYKYTYSDNLNTNEGSNMFGSINIKDKATSRKLSKKDMEKINKMEVAYDTHNVKEDNYMKLLEEKLREREIETNKYVRNKINKFFLIICNFVKNARSEKIKYEYKFVKGLQYKQEFKYYLHKYKTLEIKKYYFANQVYTCKIYSDLFYDKHKILIQHKYELHYYSKYFHYL